MCFSCATRDGQPWSLRGGAAEFRRCTCPWRLPTSRAPRQSLGGRPSTCGATPGAVPNWTSCSALLSVLLIRGLDNPCSAPSPTVKCVTGGQGTLMPLPPPQLLPCQGLVARWLCHCVVLAGHAAAGTRACTHSSIAISEKHSSEMCKHLKSSVISFMLTKNRFLADFFFPLAVLVFSLKMRRRKVSLQGEGQAETLTN